VKQVNIEKTAGWNSEKHCAIIPALRAALNRL
jgi:hypothetical protein